MRFLIGLVYLLFSAAILANETVTTIRTSELLVDLTHPKILYTKNASLRLIPASVTKLFIAANALDYWGSTHTFSTQVYQRGQLQDGVLQGDIVFYGLGDPAFTNEKIWALINRLRQIGLKKITGRLIINTSYFGKIILKEPDRIQAIFYSKAAYDGLPSSLGTNFGTIAVYILPGKKVGNIATVKVLPYPLKNVLLNGNIITSVGQSNTIQLQRVSKDKKEILSISGNIGQNSKPITLYRSVGDPNLATASLLAAFLKQAGIVVNGDVMIESTPLWQTDKLLAYVESDSLIHSLQDMLRYSNNYMADMLMLNLWKETQTSKFSSIQLNEASKLLLKYYQPLLIKTNFIQANRHDFPSFENASGLTPNNRLSARDLVILLEGMYQNKRDFPLFYGSLVIPAQQKFWHGYATVEHPWMAKVSIKTGHLNVPKAVDSIAGYCRLQNGDIGAFAVLFNSPPEEDEKAKLFKQLINHLDGLFRIYH